VATGLPGSAAEELKGVARKELAKSALSGWVNANPGYAKELLKSGKFDPYIDGDLKQFMYGQADQAIRAKDADAERARREQERVIKEKQAATQNSFLAKMVDGKLTATDVLRSNLDPFGSGSKEQFIQMMKSAAEKPPKTDPATFRALFDRIHLPDGDPKKILDDNELNEYVVKGLLDYDDLNNLRGEVQGRKTEQGRVESDLRASVLKSAEDMLVKRDKLTGIADPDGEEQYLRFKTMFYSEFDRQRKEGKSPLDLLSPDSPDYLGKHIRPFVKTPQQMLKDGMRRLKPIASPAPEGTPSATPDPKTARLPKESAADYLKRLGK
jgi:hypothetical protein